MNKQNNQAKPSNFDIIGYTKEYDYKGKFVGYEVLKTPDRTKFGMEGKKTEVLKKDVTLSNKKILKKGSEVITQLTPLYGKSNLRMFGILNKK
jgi:hypothetical protein